MAIDSRSDRASDPSAAAAAARSAVAPSGTHAVVVHSDLRCPWAHVAIHRLIATAERLGVEDELCIDHRWFPLDDGALPAGEDLDRMLAPIRELEPDAGWTTWADSGARFPSSSRLAGAWVQAAKGHHAGASMGLDRALRRALFAEGRDIDDAEVVEDVARAVGGFDIEAVRAEADSGRPARELDRHAEVSEPELVPASPTIVVADGSTWTNPGIAFHLDDGIPVVDDDDPAVHDEILETYLSLRHYD